MAVNYDEADKIVSMTDVARAEAKPSGRSAALSRDSDERDEEPKKEAKVSQEQNVVAQQMKANQVQNLYDPVFRKLHDAVHAAEQACQKAKEGIQSKQAMDDLIEETLTDLASVIEQIRDSRKSIIAAKRDPDSPASVLLP